MADDARLDSLYHEVFIGDGKGRPSLVTRMSSAEEAVAMIQDDFYNHGRDGFKTQFLKYVTEQATRDEEQKKAQDNIKEEQDRREDEREKRQERRDRRMTLYLTAVGILLALLSFLETHRQFHDGQLKWPTIFQKSSSALPQLAYTIQKEVSQW